MGERNLTNQRATGFATRAIHHGYDPLDHQGALSPPLHLTSTFAFPSAAEGGRRFAGEAPGYIYGRIGNPTVALLETRLASLEGGEAALATASGMGAITSAIWSLLKPGDEILTDLTLYGCTFAFFRHGLAQFGITVRHADLTDLAAAEAGFGPRTRLVYFETPANPNMRLVDIAAIAELAHARGALVMVDNTYATPLLQRPLSLGADLVVHSATKYLGGHGDLLAGAAVGRQELIERMRLFGLKDMTGAVLSPFDAFLVLRGLKTLEVRMERHCRSALHLAQLLEAHPAVAAVHYPGLASAPQHDLARRQMPGGFGGMIAFELEGGFDAGLRFMDALELVTIAVSLGDAETLVQHPASMTHSPYSPEERAAHGISEGLIRLSVGLESVEDLEADIGQALDRALDMARAKPLRRAG
ncbi:methionine gamma-lyase [Aliidongia dinghuensis]|uniref:L-methionine gamma-lyase n=1 Tax=Aliidongia dinghuensis TaxID=1867774 RepID=A0A8J3E1X9_9PROT|nr:methionine gamma-lyase [Aliidongia dinghuensis]GGF03547.1 methionine gamma-lyase [Aliidongia dinghuensis]